MPIENADVSAVNATFMGLLELVADPSKDLVIAIEKEGKPVAVLMSFQEYEELLSEVNTDDTTRLLKQLDPE